MESSARRRTGYALPSEELTALTREDAGPVLDDQEQQELIDIIRNANEQSDQLHIRSLQMILLVSFSMQAMFLFTLMSSPSFYSVIPTPLSPFFSARPAPLIPLASLFTVLNLVLHAYDGFYLSMTSTITDSTPLYINIPQLQLRIPQQGLYLLPPILSLLMFRDYPQTLYWSLPAVLVGFSRLTQSWMVTGHQAVEGLEELKYDAKGA